MNIKGNQMCYVKSLKDDVALLYKAHITLLEQSPLQLVWMPLKGYIRHKWTEVTEIRKAES